MAKTNSGAFYFAAPNDDWTTPENASLWRDAVKTQWDPCPAGWRVPRGGVGNETPWPDDLLTQAVQVPPYPGVNGSFNLPAYPAPAVLNVCGGRSCALGNIFGNRERGWWWTTSFIDNSSRTARTLSIYSSKAANQANPRGDSFSVRCIRE